MCCNRSRRLMKKIKVKDYYAIKRANKRAKILTKEKRSEIARKGANIRWQKQK